MRKPHSVLILTSAECNTKAFLHKLSSTLFYAINIGVIALIQMNHTVCLLFLLSACNTVFNYIVYRVLDEAGNDYKLSIK